MLGYWRRSRQRRRLAQGPVALDPAKLKLASANALVLDATDNRAVYSKFADDVTPIASLTKLMTAIVTLEGGQSLDEPIAIDMDDFDYVKGTRSRLRMGDRAHPARDAAARPHVLRESCGVVACALVSRRHACVRRGDERQGGSRSG